MHNNVEPNRSTSLDPSHKIETNVLAPISHLFSLYTLDFKLWANHMGVNSEVPLEQLGEQLRELFENLIGILWELDGNTLGTRGK